MSVQLTEHSLTQFSLHVSSQNHAMAGATIAASAALATGLGEACVQISARLQDAASERTSSVEAATQLAALRQQLLALADEDGAAIAQFAALRDAGETLQGQVLLCRLPVQIGSKSIEAAQILQDFRQHVIHVEDDLEMAITLLYGASQAASLLLDSNLRIWPEPDLLETFEPELIAMRQGIDSLHPVERIRR